MYMRHWLNPIVLTIALSVCSALAFAPNAACIVAFRCYVETLVTKFSCSVEQPAPRMPAPKFVVVLSTLTDRMRRIVALAERMFGLHNPAFNYLTAI